MSKMVSGESYTLSQIFSGENDKVVIPDLQRDYCWGDPNNNLVESFVKSLLELDKTSKITMGLIYGYYDAFTKEHLQLCDGQQRLTTLFLVIGIINRKLDFKDYGKYLVSDFERNDDDKEPYLQYAVRESSLYFLSDLTYYYFLNPGISDSASIKDQPWYLSEYELDPTVQNILNAIYTIEKSLKGINRDDLKDLADFIVNKIEFLFYDMIDRENGEETFVVINTTGEPLSRTQNLKPLMVGENDDDAFLWEEMETWFWQNRRKDAEYPHTSDEGMECFLNVVRILESKSEEEAYNSIESTSQFPYKVIGFGKVYDWFKIYRALYNTDFTERHDSKIIYPKDQVFYRQAMLYAIAPTMEYCAKFGIEDKEYIKRIYHLFSNIAKYSDVGRYKDEKGLLRSRLYNAINIIKNMDGSDVLSLKSSVTKEEQPMFEMIEANLSNDKYSRSEIELLLAEAEDNGIFNGRIGVLVRWSGYDVDTFIRYWKKFQKLWLSDKGLDTLRRALLTRKLASYPITRKGYGNLLSMCNQDDNWYQLITSESEHIKEFLDDERSLDKQIEAYSDTDNPYYEIVKNPELIQFSEYKNVYLFGNILILMKKERTNSDYKIIIDHTIFEKGLLSQGMDKWTGWLGLWQYNEDRIYSDNTYFDLTIDCYIVKDGFRIKVWKGKNPARKPYQQYEKLAKAGLTKVPSEGSWTTGIIQNTEEAKNKLSSIAKIIDQDLIKEL